MITNVTCASNMLEPFDVIAPVFYAICRFILNFLFIW